MMTSQIMFRRAFWFFAAVSIAFAAAERRANALWMKQSTQKWPNGVVYVCMTQASVNHPNAATLRGFLEQAAARFSNVARIKFVSRLPACAGGPFDAANVCPSPWPAGTLVIDYAGGAFNSGVGYSPNFPTVSQMDPDTGSASVFGCESELGHALGFEHEQDRDENIGGSRCPIGIHPPNQQVAQDHLRTTFDYWSIESYCRGTGSVLFTQRDVLGLKIAYGSRVSIGIFNAGGWWLDLDGDGLPNSYYDVFRGSFGQPGDRPVVMRDLTTGGCANAGHSRVAIYRGNGLWSIDVNLNGQWNPGDPDYYFGTTGDLPTAGLFGGSPMYEEEVVYRNGNWYMDANASGYWEGGSDRYAWFGIAGDIPIVGAWATQTSGWLAPRASNIGVFRPSDATWSLDMNGNGTWDAGDVWYQFGAPGDVPVVGDWNGDGRTKIGVYRNGWWYLDFNGNGVWDPDEDTKDVSYWFGQHYNPGDTPVVGDW